MHTLFDPSHDTFILQCSQLITSDDTNQLHSVALSTPKYYLKTLKGISLINVQLSCTL